MWKDPFEDITKALGGWGAAERAPDATALKHRPAGDGPSEPSDLVPKKVYEVARGVFARWLSARVRAGHGADVRRHAKGQPMRLRLLGAILREAGNPEADLMRNWGSSVTGGALRDVPRQPEVFEELARWRLKQDEAQWATSEKANYSSVEDHSDWLRERFQEEVDLGRVVRMSREELVRRRLTTPRFAGGPGGIERQGAAGTRRDPRDRG